MKSPPTDEGRGGTPARTAVRRLALGRAISFTGTFAAGTALTFTIYQRTRSTAWVSATMLLTWGLIGFFGPLAGTIGDRFDRRRVMIASEVGATVCWIAMAFLVEAPAALLAVAFASSVFEAPYFPASGAAIPNLAGEEHLSWANSLVAMGRNTGLTLGPVVGGVLVAAIGPRWVFAANAASYAVSAILTWSVRARFADPNRTVEQAEEHRGVAAGWRFILADRVLRQMMIAWFVFLVGMATTIVADPVLAESFRVGSLGYGLITACWGGGTILGALLARRIREQSEAAWLVGSAFLLAATGFGVALSPWFGLALVWVLAFGLADGPTIVVEQNLLQRRTPDVVRSRVMGAWDGHARRTHHGTGHRGHHRADRRAERGLRVRRDQGPDRGRDLVAGAQVVARGRHRSSPQSLRDLGERGSPLGIVAPGSELEWPFRGVVG